MHIFMMSQQQFVDNQCIFLLLGNFEELLYIILKVLTLYILLISKTKKFALT